MVEKAKNSMCIVTIKNSNNKIVEGSGFLITPTCVVTAMHAFEKENWSDGIIPSASLSSVKFINYDKTFEIESFEIDPKPFFDSGDKIPSHLDFVVLKLKSDPTSVSVGKVQVAEIQWDWGLSEVKNKSITPKSDKAFILHQGLDPVDVSKHTWCISYANEKNDYTWTPNYYHPFLSINIPYTI